MAYNVLLFPGQGSYKPDLGKLLYRILPSAEDFFKTAQDILNIDFEQVLLRGNSEQIKDTAIQQPLICIINAAYLHYLKAKGISPYVVLGHSLGELSACYAAGVINFKQLITIALERGKLMQKAADRCDGGMIVVIGIRRDQITKLLEKENLNNIDIANINTDTQVVLSGLDNDLDKLETIIRDKTGAVTRRLHVSGPWHSHYMLPIVNQFKIVLDSYNFMVPTTKLYMSYYSDQMIEATTVKDALVKQLFSPVDWISLVRKVSNNIGDTRFIEVGLSTVLKGLNKYILPNKPTYSISNIVDEKKLIHVLTKERIISNVACT